MTNDDGKVRVKSGSWVIPQVANIHGDVTDIKIGDLAKVAGRLALILDIKEHKEAWIKKVKLRWLSEEQDYWISFNTFTELYGGKANDQEK